MRTMLVIAGVVAAAAAACVATVVWLIATYGPVPGGGSALLGVIALVVAYRRVVQPWQHRWGASDAEVARAMPGDDVIPGAATTTRAIGIAATPTEVWPWLVQIGHGRAGWYSYDWIDNDGHRSATSIIPELQTLSVGDQILMVPGMGPRVRALEDGAWILSGDEQGGTWCLAVHPDGVGHTRLVSRWRVKWHLTPASAFWILISDPGSFIMERRMLLGIKARAEATAARPSRRTAVFPLVALALLLTACAAGANPADGDAGFWLGLWHGLIAPVTFVISLFGDGVGIYEVNNSGGWYDGGFVLGLGFIVGGGSSGARTARR
jgi:hypothetical protein